MPENQFTRRIFICRLANVNIKSNHQPTCLSANYSDTILMDKEILAHPSQQSHFQLRRRQSSICSMWTAWHAARVAQPITHPPKKAPSNFRSPAADGSPTKVGNKSGRRRFPNGVMLLWALFFASSAFILIQIYIYFFLFMLFAHRSYYCIKWRGKCGGGSLLFLLFAVLRVILHYLYMNWGSPEPCTFPRYYYFYYYACRVCCRKDGKQYLFILTLFAWWGGKKLWHDSP